MKTIFTKLLLTLYTLHCVSFVANAQWIEQNPNTSNWLKDIYCIDANTCYAVGNSETIIKTTDGGINWFSTYPSAGAQMFPSVFFINSNIGFVGQGNDFAILKTTDGGNNWTPKSTGYSGGNNDIFFVNDSVGFASIGGGGQIVKTTDAGETWNWSGIIGPTGSVAAVYFTDEDTGYAVENYFPDGRIWKTVNGGSNWTQMHIELGIDFADVFFINDTIGFSVGTSGTILKTIDAGINWTLQSSGTTNALTSIFCIDADTCYTVGGFGTVLKTTDGGNNWMYDTAGVPNNGFNAVFFPTPYVGYAVANGPAIIKTGTGVGINYTNKTEQQISVFPNPVKDKTYIIVKNGKFNNLQFELYTIQGKKVVEYSLSGSVTELNLNNCSKGFYIYKLKSRQQIIATGKIIKI